MAAPMPLWSVGRFPRRLRRLLPLLGVLLLLGLPLSPGPWAGKPSGAVARPLPAPAPQPVAGGSSPPPPAWITLEGRRILEIRSAAGAQTPASVAERGSAILRRLADNPAVAPEQLEVREDPPYSMLGLESGGRHHRNFPP
jgi:hypothetical protein